jgi:hypothetical protein
VLGLESFSILSSVINQSEARAFAATELVVEAVDLWLSFNLMTSNHYYYFAELV